MVAKKHVLAVPEKEQTALAMPGVAWKVSQGDIKTIASALPRTMRKHASDFLRVAMVDIPRNPALARAASANPQSAIASILDAARLGLQFGPLGHVYLVPYNVKGAPVVQLQIGYRGLEELARRSGQVKGIYSQVVYRGDEWKYEPLADNPIHHIPSPDVEHTKANVLGAYAAARLTDGVIVSEYMMLADIEGIRKRSRSGDNGPWVTDFSEMARKTALRRLCKHLPMSVEASLLVANDADQIDYAGDVALLSPTRQLASYVEDPVPSDSSTAPVPVSASPESDGRLAEQPPDPSAPTEAELERQKRGVPADKLL